MTLEEEVENTLVVYEKYVGKYKANETRQKIQHNGIKKYFSKLMKSPDLQSGFKILRDNNALEYSFEQVILNHSEEFDKNTVEVAKWRLEHPYDLLLQ